LFDRLRNLLAGSSSGSPPGSTNPVSSSLRTLAEPKSRQSNGLEQFFSSLRDRSGLRILDFAGASQANVSFITSMGHSLASEDFMRSLELAFGDNDFYENQGDPRRADEFLQENLAFPADNFDGALVWDCLQFLTPHLLQITVDRLYDALRPDSYMLAFFYANEKAKEIPIFNYRITDEKTLLLTPKGYRAQGQQFNNRSLEKLFHRFQGVKFFLTRDNLREVIIRR
jgi:hypothetical protein